MTAAEIVARLSHHHRESAKCIADYYRFGCDCGKHPVIESFHMSGRRAFTCYCGVRHQHNFLAALASAGPCAEHETDPWSDCPLPR